MWSWKPFIVCVCDFLKYGSDSINFIEKLYYIVYLNKYIMKYIYLTLRQQG